MSKIAWIIMLICLLMIGLFTTYTYIVYTSRYDGWQPDDTQRDAAIVLGAALWDNKPSPALIERLNAGLTLYRQHKVDLLILSGGKGDSEQQAEAEAMQRYLLAHGVPREKMLLETASHNTKENLANTARLLQQQRHISSLILVTHDYHMARALLYAKAAKLQVTPVPVHSTVLFLPYHKLRECAALWKYHLFDRILGRFVITARN